MGSERFRFWLGGAVAIGAVVFLQQHGPGLQSHRVALDPQRGWDKAKVPDRAPTVLERRLGEVAALAAGRSVQVRCEDFSDGTPVEPGGVVQFRGNEPAEFARIDRMFAPIFSFSRFDDRGGVVSQQTRLREGDSHLPRKR